jgi:hypothetical protein
MICEDCKQDKPCRLDTTDTAFGPRFVPVCVECYQKVSREIAAEFRKFFASKPPPRTAWARLDKCE